MINIAMKSKGSLNQDSLLTINNNRVQGTLSAQNLSILNRPAAQRPVHTNPPMAASQYPHTQTAAASQYPYAQTAAAPNTNTRRTAAASSTNTHMRTTAASGTNTHKQTTAASGTRPAPPLRRSLPPLARPVQKGQKAPLTAGNTPPGILKACFGWNTANAQCDVDVSAFLLGADGKVIGDSWFVFYGQTKSPDNSCSFETGGSTDRESITIDFRKLNANVKKIVFVMTINDAFAKRLHFGMMKDAYIRILNERGTECVSFLMTEYYSNVISMMIGEIYQYNGSWKFNAVGNGVAKDLAGLCALYGVEVI